jgi:hypothetical protein
MATFIFVEMKVTMAEVSNLEGRLAAPSLYRHTPYVLNMYILRQIMPPSGVKVD